MRTLLRLLLLGSAFGLGTVTLGWLAVPGIAILWGITASTINRPVILGGSAAMLSWMGLLGWTAAVGRLPTLLARLAGIFRVPGVSLVLLTLVLGGLLAGLGTAAGAALSGLYRSSLRIRASLL